MDKIPKYFLTTCEDLTPAALISDAPDLPSAPWVDGHPIYEDVPNPLVYTLNPDYPGYLQPLYYEESIPLIRDDLLEALQEAGVGNLELFPAVIRDEVKNIEHKNYKAFNILGVISCADMDRSKLTGTSSSKMVDVDFNRLYIDKSKTGGALLFRFAEAVTAIIVYRSVKKIIEAKNIEGMTFYKPWEWSG